ncbi:MAG: thioredoxin family protein [Bacteroidia bacterium]
MKNIKSLHNKGEIMNDIIKKGIQNGMSYGDYQQMIDSLLAENKTTGPNQSEEYIDYTKLNVVRMRRLDKTTRIRDNIQEMVQSINRRQTWLVITEAWCGDAAQIVPVVNKLADLNPNITVKHVLRDENPELMDMFLTNGARSIPMIVFIDDETNEVVGKWGPRPEEIQQAVMARKSDPAPISYSEFAKEIQKWYAKDKTTSIQQELTTALAGSVS